MRNNSNNNNTASPLAQNDDVARQNYALNGKIMLCSVIILVAAVFVIFGFHSYARCLLRRRRRRRHHHVFHSSAGAPPQGLDPAVLKSLPTFAFSSAAAGEDDPPPPECAVCLSEFQNDELGRVLPKCNHTFHADCIDMWFLYHSNCPLCRAPVRPPVPEVKIAIPPEPPGSQPEPASELASSSSGSLEPGSAELKDPGNRVVALKRIWSV